jgi:ABC-2 type transport system ATP-binding protein
MMTTTLGAPPVLVEGVTKRYGDRIALADVSLESPGGTVLALLGPNGAGKTTLIRVLTTLIRPDAGRAVVAGHDVVTDAQAVRRAIGLVGQHEATDEYLTGRENLTLVGRLLRLGRAELTERVDSTLEAFQLADVADQLAATYSGGMRRRLDVAVTLLTRPTVVFLDEPTTGLDPASRRQLWLLIDDLAAEGTSILLSTQYLDEADRLADTVAVLDHGRLIETGTPDELKARLQGDSLHIRVADVEDVGAGAEVLAGVGEITEVDRGQGAVDVRVPNGVGLLPDALRRLDREGLMVTAAEIRRPGLDDVLFALTGDAAPGPEDGNGAPAKSKTRKFALHGRSRS